MWRANECETCFVVRDIPENRYEECLFFVEDFLYFSKINLFLVVLDGIYI